MSERVARHQFFQYSGGEPFHFYNIRKGIGTRETLDQHWHEELEVAFITEGKSLHYINGECYEAVPGRMVVTNSEFIHNIIPVDVGIADKVLVAVVVVIDREFILNNFPDFQNIYFTNDKLKASEHVQEVMRKISDYIENADQDPYMHLYGKSLVLELLYCMSQEGVVARKEVDNINVLKDIERMKGVIQFVENHYREHISQAMVAEKFYFSPVYFSKYFKKCMGMTFTEYLTVYRLNKARLDLLRTGKSVSQIAMDNGFSDDRGLIAAFRKKYGTTPLQYKKQQENLTK